MEPDTSPPAAGDAAPRYGGRDCHGRRSRASRLWVGLLLIGLGLLFGLAAYGAVDVAPLSQLWPLFLLVPGVAITVRSGGRAPGGFVLLFLGTWFLLRNFGMLPLPHRLFPASILVVVGLSFVVASLVPRRAIGWGGGPGEDRPR